MISAARRRRWVTISRWRREEKKLRAQVGQPGRGWQGEGFLLVVGIFGTDLGHVTLYEVRAERRSWRARGKCKGRGGAVGTVHVRHETGWL